MKNIQNLKKPLIFVGASLVGLLVIFVLIPNSRGENTKVGKLIKSGTLTVCTDPTNVPFSYKDGDKNVGIDIEVISAIAKKMDLKVAFVNTSGSEIKNKLASNKCDLIASAMTITEDAKLANKFSDPYFYVAQSILVKKSNKDELNDLNKFVGKVVGVRTGSSGEAFSIENAYTNGYTVKPFDNEGKLLSALKLGTVSGVLDGYPNNAYREKENDNLVITKQFTEGQSYGFVVSLNSDELIKAVNEKLTVIQTNGDLQKILASYTD